MVSQTVAIDDISCSYCFPTCLNHIIFIFHYSSFASVWMFCSCYLLFLYCDIVYNLFILFMLLWGRCLTWVDPVCISSLLGCGSNKVVKYKYTHSTKITCTLVSRANHIYLFAKDTPPPPTGITKVFYSTL